jgi:hypothetical protein
MVIDHRQDAAPAETSQRTHGNLHDTHARAIA